MIMRIAALIIGYLFGNFQTSYIYGKMHGIDIRTKGSGNAGTTNTLRTLGKKAGAIVMIGDIIKCVIAVYIVHFLFGAKAPQMDYLLRMYAGLGCILGHNYPFYMNFKGGKGVACTGGLIIAMSLPMTLIGIVLFFGTIALTHYVSLGSLLVGAEFLIGIIIMAVTGKFQTTTAINIEIVILAAIISGMMYEKKKKNIRALLTGTERKTYIFKSGK